MPRQRNSGATQRNLFDSHGAGKGDRDRTVDRVRFNLNMREVKLDGKVIGLVPINGGRLRKTYV